MNDQALGLRIAASLQRNSETRIVTIVSGKGGVGKTSFALNLAVSFTRKGKRVFDY